MTSVYRILRRPYASKPLDGEGAYRFGGRWSSRGTRVAYTSEHFSLAMLEYFVHLDPGDLPKDLVSVRADVPGSISRISLDRKQLPGDWRNSPAPPELAEIGDHFVRDGKATILIVPSALVPDESDAGVEFTMTAPVVTPIAVAESAPTPIKAVCMNPRLSTFFSMP